MTFWLNDVNAFLADFGTTATLVNYPSSGSTSGYTVNTDIKAIFDEAQNVVDLQTGQVISAKPQLMAKSTAVSAVVRRSQVIVNGVTYYVNDILDDGTGITVLQLSER